MSAKTGLWIIGGRGAVATTVAVGWSALKAGAAGGVGLVTERNEFAGLDFCDWNDVIIAGQDIQTRTLCDTAREMQRARILSPDLIDAASSDLAAIDSRIQQGVNLNAGQTIDSLATEAGCLNCPHAAEAISQVQKKLFRFKSENNVQRVVVVNLASTEPVLRSELPTAWAELESRLDDPGLQIPPSTIYAVAAMKSGHSYVNFTPSVGSDLPALRELAETAGVCHAGRDGKTGETWLKSLLAPAFAARNLEILSWVGHNILGNSDGKVLSDPDNLASKVESKDALLGKILGYQPQTHVGIEFIQSLGDWKTAWDHIHFSGFLGTPMTMQFTWQGCDSILAAPLVLDLFRLVDVASRKGEVGELSQLASFFKSPQGTNENDFFRQYQMLLDWVGSSQTI